MPEVLTGRETVRVSIVSVEMTIGAMARLFVKIAIAAIPALLILFAVSSLLLWLQIALRSAMSP